MSHLLDLCETLYPAHNLVELNCRPRGGRVGLVILLDGRGQRGRGHHRGGHVVEGRVRGAEGDQPLGVLAQRAHLRGVEEVVDDLVLVVVVVDGGLLGVGRVDLGLLEDVEEVVEVVVRGDGGEVPLQLGEDRELHGLEERNEGKVSLGFVLRARKVCN